MKKIANFLNKTFSDDEIMMLANHLKIENFRNNETVNYSVLKKLGILIDGEESFVRNGKNGSYKDRFDDGLETVANKWIEENLKDTGIIFPK